MKAKTVTVKTKSQPAVVMEAEVARKIRQHSRSSMKAEVCGVLIGSIEGERTVIEACIAGINAAQGGAHVTFTQDTWEHIYKIKDQQYPEEKIVGWYHSHPGFGVFLSEHDLFIQENFFSSPQQVAWVYDPHTDEEGCFGWIGGKIEKLPGLRFGYAQNVEIGKTADVDDEENPEFVDQIRIGDDGARREPAWVKWVIRVAGSLVLLVVGFALGYQYVWWRIGPDLDRLQQKLIEGNYVLQQCGPELRSCVNRMNLELGPGPLAPGEQPSQPQKKAPAAPGKGNDGKH